MCAPVPSLGSQCQCQCCSHANVSAAQTSLELCQRRSAIFSPAAAPGKEAEREDLGENRAARLKAACEHAHSTRKTRPGGWEGAGGQWGAGGAGGGRRYRRQRRQGCSAVFRLFLQTACCRVCKNTKTKSSENLTRHPKTQAWKELQQSCKPLEHPVWTVVNHVWTQHSRVHTAPPL